MTEAERLNLRAQQILDLDTLSQNQRVPNANALLKHLQASVIADPSMLATVLSEVSDHDTRVALRKALTPA